MKKELFNKFIAMFGLAAMGSNMAGINPTNGYGGNGIYTPPRRGKLKGYMRNK